MSTTTDSFQEYISQTLSAEAQAVADKATAEETRHRELLAAMRRDLQAALDVNDQKKAIRIVHQLLQDDEESEDLQALNQFLLTRVGMDPREAWFAFSREPLVKTLSVLFALIPTVFLAVHLLASGLEDTKSGIDVVACLLAALVPGIPFIDCMVASIFNRVNHYRLRQ
jgi:hypothetical protein